MLSDFVMPKDNEKKLLSMAEKLGYAKLVFIYLYDKKVNKAVMVKKIADLAKETKLQLDWGLAVSETKQIQKANQLKTPVIFQANPESDVRAAAEKHKPQFITNLEFQKHDFVHHRSSGINQVIASAMHNNNISFVPSFPLLFSTKYKAEVIGRMIQNIRLAKKYKVDMRIYSFARKSYEMFFHKDLLAFILTLGTNQKQAKNAFSSK